MHINGKCGAIDKNINYLIIMIIQKILVSYIKLERAIHIYIF